MSKITRKVYFYKGSFQKWASNSTTSVNPALLFNFVNNLSFVDDMNNPSDRYLHTDSRRYFISNYSEDNDSLKGCVTTTRMIELPMSEKLGQSNSLNLDDDEGLMESSHFVYFKNTNILAMEYNHFGPRHKTLSHYLLKKAISLVDEIEFSILLNNDIQSELANEDEIVLLSFKVPGYKISQTEESFPDIFKSLQASHELYQSKDIEIIMRWKKGEGNTITSKIREIIPFLSRDENRNIFEKLTVKTRKSDSSQINDINLLKDKLEAEVEVDTTSRYSTIDSNQMFDKIKVAYESRLNILNNYE